MAAGRARTALVGMAAAVAVTAFTVPAHAAGPGGTVRIPSAVAPPPGPVPAVPYGILSDVATTPLPLVPDAVRDPDPRAAVPRALFGPLRPVRPVAPVRPPRDDHGPTARALEDLVRAGVPGVTAQVRDRAGVWRSAAGTGDLHAGTPRGTGDHYRVGSITKTFVAVALLRLEADGRLDLDDTVDRWLPGLVRGHGHDGRRITVRQLLNHTSGIRNYTADQDFNRKYFRTPGFHEHRYDTVAPGDLVRIALRHPADFPPGTSWNYSNTNYVLAGMIIERITGRPYGETVRDRVIRPLGLSSTTVPGTDPRMPRPGGRAYSKLSADPAATRVHDVTRFSPTFAHAAGEIISTSADLTRFYSALLGGRLLPPEQLAAMTTTVESPRHPGAGYGLGIVSRTTSCGVQLWGHGGGMPGSLSQAVSTRDGRKVLAYNLNGDWTEAAGTIEEAEFCESGSPAS
ncbi:MULTISPECIES: serine hydrolase domain-containing protein [unclassified Streptomyces]|uniref:serine hydrolase domain-containing protein n=1 Tax=unclassified Streptomyces TaxID=2593676 RepID=UPI0008237A0F|nr:MULTISPECIES: serine hydrolase domain-containing protein [unclassified Streptomyces]SCK22297.1 D-alanyl-D-alanine carboxypeptidase [Streptomyces sp. AmelKG-E11A]